MQQRTPQAGFTLIELIVSLGVFSIVVTIAIGALLVLVATNQQLQAEQTVMTNLSFALDSMTREIRTGTHYYCSSRPNESAGGVANIFRSSTDLDNIDVTFSSLNADCASGNNGNQRFHGVAFREGGNSIADSGKRILYYFDRDEGKIYRRTGTNAGESIVSDGIYINKLEFFVTATIPVNFTPTNARQPVVTIFIEARDINDPTAKPYYIQTSVTQRTLDL